jgi:hypothetical protein
MKMHSSQITCGLLAGAFGYAVMYGHDEPHQPDGSLAPSLPLSFSSGTSNAVTVSSNILATAYHGSFFALEQPTITEQPLEYSWQTHHGFDLGI